MLHREIIAVCFQIHTKHINTLCGQNVEVLYVKPRGTYKVKCTLIQALRLCTGRTARRGSIDITVLFYHGTRRG